MNRRTTKCMIVLGLFFVALPEPAPAQSDARPIGIFGSYRIAQGTEPIEIAAKRRQRARLPACPLNAGATTTCTCPVTGGSNQICKPGEVCSTAGCGG